MDSAGQYVATKAIKEAVRGQEIGVLGALSIPWEDGQCILATACITA